jgi:chemotaxis protein methyltransferase CheR
MVTKQTKTDNNLAFGLLLNKIRRERGLDCRQYKPAFLERRLAVRLRARGVESYQAYARLLDDDEYDDLFGALTINLTRFFRDATTYAALRDEVLQPMFQERNGQGRRQFQAWSAGCASGEEAYSLAILLHQLLGRQSTDWQIRILGTDLDRRMLEQARSGIFGPFSFRGTQWPDLDRFFVAAERGHAVVPEVMRWVRFRHHDLIREEPPGRFDLILCRNVLIYFTRPQQVRLCAAIHRALKSDGVLVLGKTEILPAEVAGLFETVNLREHIYRKSAISNQ